MRKGGALVASSDNNRLFLPGVEKTKMYARNPITMNTMVEFFKYACLEFKMTKLYPEMCA